MSLNPFRPMVQERTWTVRASRVQVARALEEMLLPYGARVRSVHGNQVVLTMGSRFLTRLVGGALSPTRWVPLAVVILVQEEGPFTQVHVRLVDNLGILLRVGFWRRAIRRRMADVFRTLEGLERLSPEAPEGAP